MGEKPLDLFESRCNEYRPHPVNRTERKGACLFDPTKANWGQTSSLALSWAEQEPAWAHLGHSLRRSRAIWPTWAQLAPNWGPTWRNLGTFGRKWGLTRLNVSNLVLCGGTCHRSRRQSQCGEHGLARTPIKANVGNSSKNTSYQWAWTWPAQSEI